PLRPRKSLLRSVHANWSRHYLQVHGQDDGLPPSNQIGLRTPVLGEPATVAFRSNSGWSARHSLRLWIEFHFRAPDVHFGSEAELSTVPTASVGLSLHGRDHEIRDTESDARHRFKPA